MDANKATIRRTISTSVNENAMAPTFIINTLSITNVFTSVLTFQLDIVPYMGSPYNKSGRNPYYTSEYPTRLMI